MHHYLNQTFRVPHFSYLFLSCCLSPSYSLDQYPNLCCKFKNLFWLLIFSHTLDTFFYTFVDKLLYFLTITFFKFFSLKMPVSLYPIRDTQLCVHTQTSFSAGERLCSSGCDRCTLSFFKLFHKVFHKSSLTQMCHLIQSISALS